MRRLNHSNPNSQPHLLHTATTCKKYTRVYSCTHFNTQIASYCRKAQARIDRGQLPRADECYSRPDREKHTRMKCDGCHDVWKREQYGYFEDLWASYLVPMASRYRDIEESLNSQKTQHKNAFKRTLIYWEQRREDSSGTFLYDLYPGEIDSLVNHISLSGQPRDNMEGPRTRRPGTLL